MIDFEPVTGRTFQLRKKSNRNGEPVREKEDVLIPFNSVGDLNERIINAYHKKLVGTATECFDYINKTPSARNLKDGVSSAYILNDGRCVLLRPHTHDVTAREVLLMTLPPEPYEPDSAFSLQINAILMPLYTRAIRVQMLADGIGITIDMIHPPNDKQIESIKEYYLLTTRERFVAEVKWNSELILKVRRDFEDFVDLVKHFHKVMKDREIGKIITRDLEVINSKYIT